MIRARVRRWFRETFPGPGETFPTYGIVDLGELAVALERHRGEVALARLLEHVVVEVERRADEDRAIERWQEARRS